MQSKHQERFEMGFRNYQMVDMGKASSYGNYWSVFKKSELKVHLATQYKRGDY